MEPLNHTINGNGSNINCSYRRVDRNNNDNINRKRKIIWFNPLFCKLCTVNIGRYFLNLTYKHFHRDNLLSKIFNRNALRIIYSRTNNISKIIYNHNRKLIDESYLENKRTHILKGNCINKKEISMGGRCNSENVIYQVNIFPLENRYDEKVYIGISAGN